MKKIIIIMSCALAFMSWGCDDSPMMEEQNNCDCVFMSRLNVTVEDCGTFVDGWEDLIDLEQALLLRGDCPQN